MQAGIDIVVAQGHDGGGHNSPIGTMALIPQVVDAVGDVPVLGAGGITDGRGIAAAMMLGAEGVWVGSAFLAIERSGHQRVSEDRRSSRRAKTARWCRAASPASRRGSSAACGPTRGSAPDKEPLPMPYQGAVSGPVLAAATRDKRGDMNPGFAGQGIGLIKSVRPAAEIFKELVWGAEQALKRSSNWV